MVGASSAINIAISIVRVKTVAVLLGPSGVGLFGLYNLVGDFAANLAGFGVQSSGIRQIAEAVGSGETERIARAVIIINRVSIVLGLLGALLLAALCIPVSRLTFGSDQQALAIALLGIAVFLRVVSSGQSAVIQGMRRIADLARMTVIGALAGTAVAVVLVYFFGHEGILPSILAIALIGLLIAKWYSRKIVLPPVTVSRAQLLEEVPALLTLGFAFMASGIMSLGAAYAVRILILHGQGIEAAGLYQSAWTIGGLYAGFILEAMGTDFFPRLTAASQNNAECNRLVNEQAQISLLLAGPGVLATLTFAPLVISLFYTAEFHPAVTLLRWICFGMLLRVVAWPIGFIVLAKGAKQVFFWVELASTIVNVALAWILLQVFGLNGAGMAFLGLYIWHGVLIYVVVRKLSGFRWSAANLRLGLVFVPAGFVTFAAVELLPLWPGTAVGVLAVMIGSIFSLLELIKLLGPQSFPSAIRPLVSRIALATGTRRVEGSE